MARIQIDLPREFFFDTEIKVRISDINYGGHVGNDAILSLIHEGRMQYLKSLGYSEMNLEGVSLIMSDAGIQFKAEAFYGDVIRVYVRASDFSRAGFNLYYKLLKDDIIVAVAKTGMVCYNYEAGKVMSVPAKVKEKMESR